MKKRMQSVLPTLLVMMAFLFLSLTSVQAQSVSTSGIAEFTIVNGNKAPITFVAVSEAHPIIKTDYLSTFPAQEPDETNQANAAIIYEMKFYQKTSEYIAQSSDVGFGIVRAYNEILSATTDKWPNLDVEGWKDDMVTLLSQ